MISRIAIILVVIATGSSLGQLTLAGPRFQTELPSEVTFTPDRGYTLDCPAAGHPVPQIGWLTSKGNGGGVGGGSGVMWSPVVDLTNLISLAPNGSLTLHVFRPEHFRPDVHAATYKCSALNPIGRILSTPVRVRAVMLPPFEATVENPRVRRGGTAVFRCNVPDSVRDHVTITSWIQDNRYDIFLTSSQDGRHVMLANGELHVLSVRQGDENHLYHCRVLVRPNGQTMTSTSAGRILLVPDSMTKTPPVIVESVNRVRVWRGQDAVLPCVFQGYPPPKIKWYRSQTIQYGNLMLPLIPVQRQEHGVGGGRYRLIGGTLVISSVVPEDQGRYVCSVNNSAGVVESRTELLFREKLQVRILEASPNSQVTANAQLVVDAEMPVTITCSFSGSPRPLVSWLKDGQRYLANGRVFVPAESPATGDIVQLHITSVQREDQGMYQCMASNDEADAAQASIQLAIGAFPPHLKQTFNRQVLHPGSSVSFKCVASGTPPPHFTWFLDGSPLPVSERYFLGQQQTGVEDEVVTHLNISHVRIEDGGHYKCVAENRVGRVEYAASLHIYGPPYVRPMASLVAVGGKRLELTCPVAGYPIEGITWEKDGRRLPLNGRQRLQFNGSLTIDPVDKSGDAGQYSCQARGQNGLTARQSLQLNIIDAPHIMPMSDSAVLNAGERLALQCAVVKGGLPLAVTWLKDGQLIAIHNNNNGNQAATSSINVRLVNDFTASLTIESLTGHHAGFYVCRASNEGGRAEAAVHVVVQGINFQKEKNTEDVST